MDGGDVSADMLPNTGAREEVSAPVTIYLLGEPVPFARTRINKTGAHFTPDKQRNAAAALRLAAQQAMLHSNCGNAVFDEPLRLELAAEFSVPASWSKRKREAAVTGEIKPAKRPDIDNLYKLAADALNGVVFRDDALIVEVQMVKRYSVAPKLIITVTPLGSAMA